MQARRLRYPCSTSRLLQKAFVIQSNRVVKEPVEDLGDWCNMSPCVGTIPVERRRIMGKYVCNPCGYIYDPAEGDPENDILPGTAFEDLPDDWVCPVCGAGKEEFSPTE